jgi:hypothetical protein
MKKKELIQVLQVILEDSKRISLEKEIKGVDQQIDSYQEFLKRKKEREKLISKL